MTTHSDVTSQVEKVEATVHGRRDRPTLMGHAGNVFIARKLKPQSTEPNKFKRLIEAKSCSAKIMPWKFTLQVLVFEKKKNEMLFLFPSTHLRAWSVRHHHRYLIIIGEYRFGNLQPM